MKITLMLQQATDGREILVWKPSVSSRIWKQGDGFIIYSPGLPIHPDLGYCYPLTGEFCAGQIIKHLDNLPPGSLKSGVREGEPGITFNLGDWSFITIESDATDAISLKQDLVSKLKTLIVMRSSRYTATAHLEDFALCLALLMKSSTMSSEDYCSINTLASLAYMGTPLLRSRVSGLEESPNLSDQAKAWLKNVSAGRIPSSTSLTKTDIEIIKSQILRDSELTSLLAGYAFCALCPTAPEMVTEFGLLPDTLAELKANLVVSDTVSQDRLLTILGKYL